MRVPATLSFYVVLCCLQMLQSSVLVASSVFFFRVAVVAFRVAKPNDRIATAITASITNASQLDNARSIAAAATV